MAGDNILKRFHRCCSRSCSRLAAVGKSAILLQFTERQFRDAHDMTIGVEFGAKDVSIGDAQVRARVELRVGTRDSRWFHISVALAFRARCSCA